MACMRCEPLPRVFTCTEEDLHGAVSPHGVSAGLPSEGLEKVAELHLRDWASIFNLGVKLTVEGL